MGKGKKIIRQAEQLGFKGFPLTILYGRPRKVRMTFSKLVPDYIDILREFMTSKDPECLMRIAKGGRGRMDVFLSVKEKIYIESIGKISGFAGMDPENHTFQISFWTENDDFVGDIVKAIDQRFSDVGGIRQHFNWKKLQKKYRVEQEDILPTWNKYLE